ncbi:MAG: hypothetical protein A2486_03535 [Burkholderiales bacterium RIFOXYC12_FULL_65_23]|uniref:TetR/AcrR family transcriptional regulator n=1 Tax=Malikia spinosa TaxID=86180 RepID=UPI0008D770A1|nr:MAG: hypothetical protein A2486_03535 [Burkholderiales bacterium RIFOXYC12_FULL_65_23]
MSSPAPSPSSKPGKRRSQTERRQDSERKLLDSGMQLVARKGVSGMTLAEVGSMAGYSRGLVAHHYGNKEQFVRALARHVQQSFSAVRAQAHASETGLDRLLHSISSYLLTPGDHRAASFAMLGEAAILGGSLQETMREYSQASRVFYAEQLRIALGKGEIRQDIDPDSMAAVILGLLRGISMQHLLDPENFPIEQISQDVLLAIKALLQR